MSHPQEASLVSAPRSPTADLDDVELDHTADADLSESQVASNQTAHQFAVALGQEDELHRPGLPFGARGVPLQSQPSNLSSSSASAPAASPSSSSASRLSASSSSASSSSSTATTGPTGSTAVRRAAHLGRTPPPPYPEYQVYGQNKAVGVKGKLFWASLKVFNAMEFVGEVFADFFGLYDSKYQYVVDAYERNKRELEYERAERQAQRREAREERERAAADADPANQRMKQNRAEQEEKAKAKEQSQTLAETEVNEEALPENV